MSRRTASAMCRSAPGGFQGGTSQSQTRTSRASLANKKPAGKKSLAGHTCPRPFSKLFYVACKPAGSNDHVINLIMRGACLPVKSPIRYRRELLHGDGKRAAQFSIECYRKRHSAGRDDRGAGRGGGDSSRLRVPGRSDSAG